MKLLTKRLSCLLLFCALFFFPSVKANANPMLTAPSVGLNSTVTGTLTQNEGIYFYKIVLPSSGYFSIHNLTSEMDRFGSSSAMLPEKNWMKVPCTAAAEYPVWEPFVST